VQCLRSRAQGLARLAGDEIVDSSKDTSLTRQGELENPLPRFGVGRNWEAFLLLTRICHRGGGGGGGGGTGRYEGRVLKHVTKVYMCMCA